MSIGFLAGGRVRGTDLLQVVQVSTVDIMLLDHLFEGHQDSPSILRLLMLNLETSLDEIILAVESGLRDQSLLLLLDVLDSIRAQCVQMTPRLFLLVKMAKPI